MVNKYSKDIVNQKKKKLTQVMAQNWSKNIVFNIFLEGGRKNKTKKNF